MKEKIKTCSICGLNLTDSYGNNAQPINDGRCCNDCNEIVINRRINDLYRKKREAKEAKELENKPLCKVIIFGINEEGE